MLTLDAVYAALLDARDTDGNWLYAYRHFPKRMVRWRSQFAFMKDVANFNTHDSSRVYQCHRSIFKPRVTQAPYCDHLLHEEEDEEWDD